MKEENVVRRQFHIVPIVEYFDNHVRIWQDEKAEGVDSIEFELPEMEVLLAGVTLDLQGFLAQAVLSFLAADYEFKVANSSYKVAKKDITGQLEWDFAVNARTAYGDIQIKGNTISTVLTEQNDFYKAIGISERKYQFTYVYNEQGLIKEAILEKSLSSIEAFDTALNPAVEWARKERPGELAEIYPNNNFVYNTQMAKRWLQLLRDWHKATR